MSEFHLLILSWASPLGELDSGQSLSTDILNTQQSPDSQGMPESEQSPDSPESLDL